MLLKAILELGNIEFDNKKQDINEENPCDIVNKDLLKSIAEILEIKVEAL